MSSSILHSCPFCGHVTDISTALADFIQNPCCSQCGLSASESNLKVQDDLAALFARQMSIETPIVPQIQHALASASAPITYSITQHYHHSAHVARPTNAESSELGSLRNSSANSISVNEALRYHNIDPSSLSPQQLELFEHAAPEQQARLIQMWQICSEPGQPHQTPAEDLEMGDSSQGGNMANYDVNGHQEAEPYMVSGYEMLAQREYELSVKKLTPVVNEPSTGVPYNLANDPIYQNQSQRWWEQTESGPTEHQYGAFEQMNRYPGCGIMQPHWLV